MIKVLSLTANAVSLIREITVRTGLPTETGIRIATSPAAGNGVPALEIAIADEPEPSDEVVESDGARVFLDPDASLVLNDKRLDATVQEGRAHFIIAGDQE